MPSMIECKVGHTYLSTPTGLASEEMPLSASILMAPINGLPVLLSAGPSIPQDLY